MRRSVRFTRWPPRTPARVVTIWANYGPHHLARMEALEDRGCEVMGFSWCASDDNYPFFNHAPARHEVINHCELASVQTVTSFRRCLGLLWRYRPDIVLTCGYERPETLAAVTYSHLRVTSGSNGRVIGMIDNKEDDRRRRRSVEILKSLYLRCFNGFMVSGSRHRSYLESLGVPGDAIREGYSCVANERIGTLASALRAEAKPLAPACDYFLCVSRFVAKKNLEYLVRSYARYKASLRPGKRAWQLVICGDGAEGPAVRRAIAEAGVGEDVTLPGRIDDPRVAVNYYAFCRAFVLPSIEAEQWGLVVNEAMAAGAPVLVSDRCGCAPDLVVPGRNGFCFDPTSEEDLAKQMRWMHDNCHTLPGMGRASMEIIERVSTARFAANVLELCELQAGRS